MRTVTTPCVSCFVRVIVSEDVAMSCFFDCQPACRCSSLLTHGPGAAKAIRFSVGHDGDVDYTCKLHRSSQCTQRIGQTDCFGESSTGLNRYQMTGESSAYCTGYVSRPSLLRTVRTTCHVCRESELLRAPHPSAHFVYV